MMNLLLLASGVSAGSWSGSYLKQPAYSASASTGAFIAQPSFATSGSFPAQPYRTGYSYGGSMSEMGSATNPYTAASFTTQLPAAQPYRTGYSYSGSMSEMGSATNPYNAESLKNVVGAVQPMTVQANKVMPIKKFMAGEEHVVDNDLQMHVNHETDKTIVTKRVVHHSPVLHKTIRTHQIAQDIVHDKKVHHMNVVEDVVKNVPGQQFMGEQESVDHTTAVAPAQQVIAPMAYTAKTMAYDSSQSTSVMQPQPMQQRQQLNMYQRW